MTYLTPLQVEQVTTLLGYGSVAHRIDPYLKEGYLETVVQRVELILTELTEIDEQLKALRPDSMAQSVAGMQLNFPQHRALLRADASNLLKELAQILGIPILFNKYATAPKAIVSYW